MARLMIEISLDNAAFSDTSCGSEAGDILLHLAGLAKLSTTLESLAYNLNGRTLSDRNGNKVGASYVTGTGRRGRPTRDAKPIVIVIHKKDGTVNYESYTVATVAGRAWRYASKKAYGALQNIARSEYWKGDPRVMNSGAQLQRTWEPPKASP